MRLSSRGNHRLVQPRRFEKSSQLSSQQTQRLKRDIERHARYFARLAHRIKKQGFFVSDPLFATATHADDALRKLVDAITIIDQRASFTVMSNEENELPY